MKIITQADMFERIKEHRRWLADNREGTRADLEQAITDNRSNSRHREARRFNGK
jgi:hypothetical protein